MTSVAIVGAGYAGMAAAVALAERGIRVTVYEAARQLGGRARAVERNDLTLDNGQHLLIGAYHNTLRLIEKVGTPPGSLLRLPLQWTVLPDFHLRTSRLPEPWHLAVGLARAKGLSVGARIGCASFLAWCRSHRFRLGTDLAASALLHQRSQHPSAIRYLWEPLCVAALNTPLEQASAQVFLNVLRDGIAARRADSDLVLPRVDLSSLFPLPAADFVSRHGGQIEPSTTVERIESGLDGLSVCTRRSRVRHSAVIVATQPGRVAAMVGHLAALSASLSQIAALTYQPIVTVYLRYAGCAGLPFPLIGMSGGYAQWLFDRSAISGQRGVIAAVISARGRQQDLGHDTLTQRVKDEIAAWYPDLGVPQWTQLIEEKRATIACVPNMRRPDQRTGLPGLYLAGDYTASEYPATIEAAVRSGLRCAELAAGAIMPAPGESGHAFAHRFG